ncbi:DUF397 domain-containing protein [Streptomyces sp. JJ66]|uniref:DUF397 domain-containing protein n=1 Tax=Streptomyces sp. JJ66 TaxID=2803843 RepID=UPI001C5989F9|nr:DUF397 domain-containing protein [Streptomyces sp. JJ66]MBW1602275.1 DUF397 domain-containing protein [Streptomyces sp. JJ66]
MSSELNYTEAVWAKSSYSQGDGGQCVEFSRSFVRSGLVPVRDSKAPAGPVLGFGTQEWEGFVSALRRGDLAG